MIAGLRNFFSDFTARGYLIEYTLAVKLMLWV